MRNLGRCAIAGVAVVLAACGGGNKGGTAGASTGATTATTPSGASATAGATGAAAAATGNATAKPATGQTHDVKMLGDAQGYRFDPKNITIKQGDAVRWTMVSGGPHDATFWADSIPAGAEAQLNANMPQTIGPLTGPLLTTPNETYTVSFAGLPKGTYHYHCTPHLAMGMVGTITVQ
ncbi:MAG TPA: plastocyanin/azurin family copper-binding protein [Gemmatimonadaceae bacterium]|nr:plastocyanin/azurin family copper-binding protein [Gemmatimonadaceae bacterium]